MKIQKLFNHTPTRQWDYDLPIDTDINWGNQSEVIEHCHPHVCYHMPEVASINEMTYKEVASMIDGNFLNQKIRADELQGVFFEEIENDTMLFLVPSADFKDNGIKYATMVKFDEWEEIGTDSELDGAEKARMLLWTGNIRLHCTCPSFLYWGYQYILDVMDASIYPEERQPVIKNPKDRGVVCKHLNRVLRVLPFHSGEISKAITHQYG